MQNRNLDDLPELHNPFNLDEDLDNLFECGNELTDNFDLGAEMSKRRIIKGKEKESKNCRTSEVALGERSASTSRATSQHKRGLSSN